MSRVYKQKYYYSPVGHEKALEYSREYHASDKGKEAMRRHNRSEKGKARVRRYLERHPGLRAVRWYAWCVASGRFEGKGVSRKQWLSILKAYAGLCAYCGEEMEKVSMDHVVPLARGGRHEPENVVPACLSCNQHKNYRTPEEWGTPLRTIQVTS
uniref:Putative homing endonuclease n=1 Tax=viral metagenome TaxID=1070528 RepID=A0A6H1Z9B6_9ZZZZ